MFCDQTIFRLSLNDVPEGKRTETLREVFGQGVVNMDFIPMTDDPQMEVEIHLLPGIAITRGWNSPYLADSGYDRSRDNDDFALVWGTSPGKGRLQHLGKENVGDNGAASFISCADRVTAETGSTFHHLTVRLHRSILCPLLPDAEAALMRTVPSDNEALQLLTSYVAGYLGHRNGKHADEDPSLAQAVAAHIGDLVALALGTDKVAAELAVGRGLRAARLHAIKRWVLARLTSYDVNVRHAAGAAGVSPRYVQLLFEAEGTTFTAYVLDQRLALAYRRLSNPPLARFPISEIAYGCGFGDLSYFDRCFRAAFGETPSDVRSRTRLHLR